MDYYVGNASSVYQAFEWAGFTQGPVESKTSRRHMNSTGTEFVANKKDAVDFFRSVTGPNSPTAAVNVDIESFLKITSSGGTVISKSSNASEMRSGADIQQIANQRVQLLAAKYAAGEASSEIIARLEILDHRLLTKAPRVSADQVRALEDANEQLLRVQAARKERAKSLQIAQK